MRPIFKSSTGFCFDFNGFSGFLVISPNLLSSMTMMMMGSCQNLKMMFFVFFTCFLYLVSALDTISESQPLKNGDTLVSSGGVFELGFFRNGDSQKHYLGIWYKKISTESETVVWVANRDRPLYNSSSGALKLTKFGTLLLVDASNTTIWSSNSSDTNVVAPIAQILDSGNLVVRNGDDDESDVLWQSFDYPGDTLLPGMKYGIDFAAGRNRFLTSWRRPDDPGTGEYYNKLDPNGLPQFFLYKGSVVQFRSGAWNGLRFSGMPNLKPNNIYKYEFVFNDNEVYYTYQLLNNSLVSRFLLSPLGVLQRYTWIDRTQGWVLYLTGQMDNCDTYAQCGPHGTCNINNSPACECLRGFEPKYPSDWERTDWSNGCVRKVALDCREGEGFLMYPSVKWPDTRSSWYNKTMNLEECRLFCLKNCSCTAYSSLDIRDGGSGCLVWFGDLVDIRNYPENGQDIYIRMAASEIGLAEAYSTKGKRRLKIILIPVLCSSVLLFSLSLIFFLWRKRKQNNKLQITGTTQFSSERDYVSEGENDDLELPLIDFATIADATDNFSPNNKLGQGGFGPVYKGVLRDGQEIAVKRLSRSSRQGLDEFKNEVLCIAKLQHRNLVKLLGCCIQVDERLLIYEYMSNKSLDFVIFDKKQSVLLDWSTRFHVINGIARGLLYLHQDSRLRIIHRDLKASNILLDSNMNPKISDFGMARTFGGDETSANTTRVVGTYGYMSPEYAIDGLFSVKSDVFSFGVLVLEIVSGKRNRGFSHPDHKMNLLGHTWKLHIEGRPLELTETSIKDSCNVTQALRAIHVGLLCVQQSPEDRPNMSTVVLMLTSDIALPQPKEPGFYTERYLSDADSSSSYHVIDSTNGLTVTLLHPR